jgi:16S rRNA (guanine527-N7)-methyltransferase
VDVLEEAQQLGFLGPGSIGRQISHSRGFLAVVDAPPGRAVDLGSGGGLPGLVLAIEWPTSSWLLLDANHRRTDFLVRAVGTLSLTDRVQVRCQRAEEAGREDELRGAADLVVARSFAPPAVTAECAAPLLRVGGHLVVAEPPGGAPSRWPAEALAAVGLRPDATLTTPSAFQRLVQVTACPDRFPRRTGIPSKRPLYR